MPAETLTHSSIQREDRSIRVYLIPKSDLHPVIYHLDQNNVFENVAQFMGYTSTDMINMKQMAKDKSISPAEQLLSVWGDQNHTVTELFVVLYRCDQFSAMYFLKKHVPKKYHQLLVYGLPEFSGKNPNRSKNGRSEKILSGPKLSRDSNESDYNLDSMQSSSIIDENNSTPQIQYHELKLATLGWRAENILGRGGFGTVYKGHWKYTEVAIKKIEYKSDDTKKNIKIQIQQSRNELRHLNSCRHDNILPLYGHSIDGPEPCLVYQFMAGGSLEKRLHGKCVIPLTFNQRKTIALGTARGLQYLHTYISEKPLIHGDIKPANVLLDNSCVPKIGDFGLVREGSSTGSMEVSSVYGTRPYLPYEFLVNRILSTKIDTYSFGVVLFELFTALKAYDKSRGIDQAFLTKFMILNKNAMTHLVDKALDPADVNVDLFEKLMELALHCTNENADTRPEMVYVLHTLEKITENDGAD